MKLGLVLEGGASRAYFSTGVMDFLLEQKIYADYVIGVSAGIANAVSYVSRQIGRNIEIGEKYVPDKRYMGMRHLLNPKTHSYYNVDFVFNEIPKKYVPFDYNAFTNSGCETVAVVTNIKTGKPEYMPVESYEKSWQTVVASCSLPLMFQPVEINGNLYFDGGITDPIPVEKALEEGCDKVIVITTRERSYIKEKENGVGLSSFMYRKYPEFVKALKSRVTKYNEIKKHLCELEDSGKIFVISPDDTSRWNRTDNDSQKIRAMHNLGYNTAKNLLPKLNEYLKRV